MWNALNVVEIRRSMIGIPRMLNFQYVDGPSHELVEDISISESMPVIRPGLYCGIYHPEMYGKFCNEILLVEYRRYRVRQSTWDETWGRIHSEVFDKRDEDEMMTQIKTHLRESGSSELVFVVGRKVTGDMHVPAGKSSFGALVHPLLPSPDPELPRVEYARSTDHGGGMTSLRVVRQWHGFGTLAYPVFRNPSTAPGILLQLENDADGNHRFGFLWNRSSDETIVLNWLPIQDKYPWFHR